MLVRAIARSIFRFHRQRAKREFLAELPPPRGTQRFVAELTRGQTVADIENVLNLTTEPRLQSPQHQNPLRLSHS